MGNDARVESVRTVKIREVWGTEDRDFTPWLASNISELEAVLGIGLANPRREESVGDFSIDIVAESSFGDVVIENQYGRSNHRHLGQLVRTLIDIKFPTSSWM